jgi:cytochrome c-type biogenesis protein
MMDLSPAAFALVFAAGLTSVLSPCVLPVIPLVITGTEHDSRWRPVFIVGGLTATFVLMGIASSLLGGMITSKLFLFERAAAALIIVFGALLIVDVNLAKYITFFNRFHNGGERKAGNVAALVAGMSLGLVWIPCVGGQLGAVLAMIATGAESAEAGTLAFGITLMLVYSLGFAIPLLLAGYASQFFRNRAGSAMKYPWLIRVASGLLLIGFGVFIWTRGMLVFQLL